MHLVDATGEVQATRLRILQDVVAETAVRGADVQLTSTIIVESVVLDLDMIRLAYTQPVGLHVVHRVVADEQANGGYLDGIRTDPRDSGREMDNDLVVIQLGIR